MSLPKTLTDIANLALLSIGEESTNNVESDEARSRTVRTVLYQCIREVQRLIDWPELRVRKTLAQNSEMLDDTHYKYHLPENYLEVISTDSEISWFLQEGFFCTDALEAKITYKKYSEEVSEWSGDLVEMVYRKLAAAIAPTLVENPQWLQMAERQYQQCEQRCLSQTQNRKRKIKRYKRNHGLVKNRLYDRYPYGGY
jgi:hypothetical protein